MSERFLSRTGSGIPGEVNREDGQRPEPHVQQYCATLLEKSCEDAEISVAYVLRLIQTAIATAIDKGDITNHLRALDKAPTNLNCRPDWQRPRCDIFRSVY